MKITAKLNRKTVEKAIYMTTHIVGTLAMYAFAVKGLADISPNLFCTITWAACVGLSFGIWLFRDLKEFRNKNNNSVSLDRNAPLCPDNSEALSY